MSGPGQIPITFRVSRGEDVLRVETLTQRIVKIGRAPSCNLQIDDDSVARTHAVVEVTGPGEVLLIATDENTSVNGKRVNKSRLSTGDVIEVGQVSIAVEIGEPGVLQPSGPSQSCTPMQAPYSFSSMHGL
ncbi:MAG: FHA domain-containing protein, partial [Myxococcota bacterium]|nr:FHA domain-containing protein [Myxococcota bacterium]